MDAIGCVISPNGEGKFDVYRIKLVDGKLIEADLVRNGEGRIKRSAMKEVEREFARISQEFTRGKIEFGEFEDSNE